MGGKSGGVGGLCEGKSVKVGGGGGICVGRKSVLVGSLCRWKSVLVESLCGKSV